MSRAPQIQVQTDQDAEAHAKTVNLVLWFFQSIDSCKYIQDPHLRHKVYTEVTEAFRMARNARPVMPPPLNFGQAEETEERRRV